MTAPARVNFSEWTCPLPLKNYPAIVMGHGSGGQMMADLIQHLFAPLFDNDLLAQLGESQQLPLPTRPTRFRRSCGTCAAIWNGWSSKFGPFATASIPPRRRPGRPGRWRTAWSAPSPN